MRASGFLIAILFVLSACAGSDSTDGTTQYPDDSFVVPNGGEPRYERARGPVVGIDEAHFNYHTADDKYRSFANLLRNDGYRVERFKELPSAESLVGVDVLVISNALSEEKRFDWSLPTPSAFSTDEVAAIENWVREGGRLMLIADHMPFPGAAENLAVAFGIVFYDSFAYSPSSWDNHESQLVFSKESGLLAEHRVTSKEGGGDVPFVVTFTGQGFRMLSGVQYSPLISFADNSFLLLPKKAAGFDQNVARISGAGLLQGALVEHGAGRVAVFGEAAMFSAQIQERADGPYPFGMNNAEAPHNARFLLNVMGWLSSDLD